MRPRCSAAIDAAAAKALIRRMDFAQRITRLPIAHDPARAAEARALFSGLSGPVVDLISGTAGCSPYLWSLMQKE